MLCDSTAFGRKRIVNVRIADTWPEQGGAAAPGVPGNGPYMRNGGLSPSSKAPHSR